MVGIKVNMGHQQLDEIVPFGRIRIVFVYTVGMLIEDELIQHMDMMSLEKIRGWHPEYFHDYSTSYVPMDQSDIMGYRL